jgi:hypothetical protein
MSKGRLAVPIDTIHQRRRCGPAHVKNRLGNVAESQDTDIVEFSNGGLSGNDNAYLQKPGYDADGYIVVRHKDAVFFSLS